MAMDHHRLFVVMMRVLLALFVSGSVTCHADEPSGELSTLLSKPMVADQQALQDVRRFAASRIPRIPDIESLEEWKKFADATRCTALESVVFRGKATEWRRA